MKHLFTSLFFILSIQFVFAQFDTKNAIYTTGELSLGNYVGMDINLNYVYQEKYSLKIGYSGNLRTARSQPDDYSSGAVGAIFLGFLKPYDQFENYQIGLGRIFKINQKGSIRLNLSIGFGYTVIREPARWQRMNNVGWLENYTWEYDKTQTWSLIINPKIEFPFTRIYGFTLSPMIQISPYRTYFGIGLGHMIGLLRNKY